MAPRFPQAVPEVPVTSVVAAAGYYVDVLGFTLDWGDDVEGIGGISQGDCRIFLSNAAFRAGRGPNSPAIIWLNVNGRQEVDALFERWNSAGATILHGVEDKPWKLREFTATDPDGNQLRVFYDFSRD